MQAPQIVPPSPDAAALGKYGQIPVDKSTGIPAISIPIYEIKTPRLTLPISLSYHASGIRVDEIASWVGMGWSLNAGGVITRSIMGAPDEWGNGFLSQTVPSAASISYPVDSLYLQNTIQGQMEGSADTQPDDFFYNFNGRAGAFVFGIDKKPVLTPYAALSIGFDAGTGFQVLDENGDQYNFNTVETVQASYDNYIAGIPSSWYLTSIISADRSDTIQLNYTTDSQPENDYSYGFTQNLGPASNVSQPSDLGGVTLWPIAESTSERSFNAVHLSSILFKGGRVDFIGKSGRLDLANVSLDSIIVSNYNAYSGQYKRLKTFKLATGYTYSTLPNPTLPGPYLSSGEPSKYRLILTDVVENDQNNAAVSSYHLDYNQTMLPPVHNFGQDMWGYYNGQYGNPTLLQSQQVTANGIVFTIGGNYGANRSVDTAAMKAGVLQRITYPTGGFTQFNYEANTQNIPQTITGGVAASAAGFYQDTAISYYKPTATDLETGGSNFTITIPHYGSIPDTLDVPFAPFVELMDTATGALIWSENGNISTDINHTVTVTLVAGHTYELVAVAVIRGATLETNTNYLPKATIGTSFSMLVGSSSPVGGLRIASIRNYDGDSTLLSTETYSYPGDGTLLSGSFLTTKVIHTAWYFGADGSASLTTYGGNSVYPLGSLSGSPVGYGNVEVYHGDKVQNSGKTTYTYSIFPDSVLTCPSVYLNGAMPVPVTWKNGEPTRVAEYKRIGNGLYAIEQEKLTNYNYFFKPNGRGLKLGYTYEFVGSFLPGNYPYWTGLDFYWFDYPISAGIRVPAQNIVNQYDSDGVAVLMSDTTSFYYDDTTLYEPTRTISKDSRGRVLLNCVYRPLEKATINSLTPLDAPASLAIDSLLARHIYMPTIEQVDYVNNNLTQLSLTNYQLWSNHILAPQNMQTQIGSNPLDTRLLFNQYDTRGNLLEMQKPGDMKQAFLWGYLGQYPVAAIQNSSYAAASALVDQSQLDFPANDAALQSQLNSLRTIPKALVTTYSYKPLVGMTTQADPQGKTTYYEYDSFQRLKDLKDYQGNILKTWDYHYKGQ